MKSDGSFADGTKRQPGIFDCIPIVGNLTKKSSNDEIDEFASKDQSWEGQIMFYMQILGGIFAGCCLAGALVADGEKDYDSSVLLLTMFAVAVFFVYFAFLNSTPLFHPNESRSVKARLMTALVLGGGFGGFCLAQVYWYRTATLNPVIVNSVAHEKVNNYGTQRITFMLTPVYPENVEATPIQTYPVLSVSGAGRQETRLELTRWDNITRVRALAGTTDFVSEKCDDWNYTKPFDIYEYVDCLPLYQEAESCTRQYQTAGFFSVPRDLTADVKDDPTLVTMAKNIYASVFEVTTTQVRTKKTGPASSDTTTTKTTYSFTVTSCKALPAAAETACSSSSFNCPSICSADGNGGFDSYATCNTECKKITDLSCTKARFMGEISMIVTNAPSDSTQTAAFNTKLATALKEQFGFATSAVASAESVVSGTDVTTMFKVATYDSAGVTVAESTCTSSGSTTLAEHANMVGITIRSIACKLYSLGGAVTVTDGTTIDTTIETTVKDTLTNWHGGDTAAKYVTITQTDATTLTYDALTSSSTQHNSAKSACRGAMGRPSPPVKAITCVADGVALTSSRRQLSDYDCTALDGDATAQADFDQRIAFGENPFFEMCAPVIESNLCSLFQTNNDCHREDMFKCCAGTCGHCEYWKAGGEDTDPNPWDRAPSTTTSTHAACGAGEQMIKIYFFAGSYPQEIQWSITAKDASGTAKAPASPVYQDWQRGQLFESYSCLKEASYDVTCTDTNNGWDGAVLAIGDTPTPICSLETSQTVTNPEITILSDGTVRVDSGAISVSFTSTPAATSGQPAMTTLPAQGENGELQFELGSGTYITAGFATCGSVGNEPVVIDEECSAVAAEALKALPHFLAAELEEDAGQPVQIDAVFETSFNTMSDTRYPKGCSVDIDGFMQNFGPRAESAFHAAGGGSGGHKCIDGCHTCQNNKDTCLWAFDSTQPQNFDTFNCDNACAGGGGSGASGSNPVSILGGETFTLTVRLNSADSTTGCSEEAMCFCRLPGGTDFTTAAPTQSEEAKRAAESNAAAAAALSMVEGNAANYQLYELDIDFKHDNELVKCGRRSCRVINFYLIMSKIDYEYVNFNFWTGSDQENAVSLIQSDRFLRVGYNLKFGKEKFLDQTVATTMSVEMIQYGEQPDLINAKKWIKVRFLIPAKNKQIAASLSQEQLTYTIGDVWTAIIATSGLAGAMFAFVFPNVLSKSFFRFAEWRPHVEEKVVVFGNDGEINLDVFHGIQKAHPDLLNKLTNELQRKASFEPELPAIGGADVEKSVEILDYDIEMQRLADVASKDLKGVAE